MIACHKKEIPHDLSQARKCIRGAAHARKANWHEGFCVSCAYNPYNMAANDGDWRSEKTDNGQSRPYFIIA